MASLIFAYEVAAQATLTLTRIPCDVISFQGTEGTEYMIQSSTNLTGTNWNNLGIVIPNGSGLCNYTNFPTTSQLFYREMSASVNVSSNAAAEITLDSANPLSSTTPATDLIDGTYLGLPVLVFDINAQFANLHLHTLVVNLTASGNGNVSAAYLYQGSTLVAWTPVSGGTVTFSIADGTAGATILGDTVVPYTIKVDVTGITTGLETVDVSLNTNQTIYNAADGSVPVYGSAQGNTIGVAGAGPLFTLASAPTITKVNITPGGASYSTFQYTATFNVKVTAVGIDLTLGLPYSSYPAFGNSQALTAIYRNGVNDTSTTYNVVVGYSQPSNTTLSSDGSSFSLSANQTVTIPVTYSFVVSNPGANEYAVQVENIDWLLDGSDDVSNFMMGQTSWRTPSD